MMNQTGAHCIENGMNRKAIGICMIGDFDKAEPPQGQFDLLVRLVRGLMEVLNIPVANVTRHSDHKATNCPGKMFPWERFISLIQ